MKKINITDLSKMNIFYSVSDAGLYFFIASLLISPFIVPFRVSTYDMTPDQLFQYFALSLEIFIGLVISYTVLLYIIRCIVLKYNNIKK